jgi:hypothetical protein
MHRLDPVGRFTPSSLDVSRAAAVRHAHLSALREPYGRTRDDSPRPRRAWFHVVVARLSVL